MKPTARTVSLAIRPDAKWEGWIVPGESTIRCVVLARYSRTVR